MILSIFGSFGVGGFLANSQKEKGGNCLLEISYIVTVFSF